MKTMLIATSMLLTATAASAADLNYFGSAEYMVEAETVEASAGLSVHLMENFYVVPVVTFAGNSDDFSFTELEVNAVYTVSQNVDAYVKVTTDEDLDYDETTVGVAFNF